MVGGEASHALELDRAHSDGYERLKSLAGYLTPQPDLIITTVKAFSPLGPVALSAGPGPHADLCWYQQRPNCLRWLQINRGRRGPDDSMPHVSSYFEPAPANYRAVLSVQ
jgi:hypothetical protein